MLLSEHLLSINFGGSLRSHSGNLSTCLPPRRSRFRANNLQNPLNFELSKVFQQEHGSVTFALFGNYDMVFWLLFYNRKLLFLAHFGCFCFALRLQLFLDYFFIILIVSWMFHQTFARKKAEMKTSGFRINDKMPFFLADLNTCGAQGSYTSNNRLMDALIGNNAAQTAADRWATGPVRIMTPTGPVFFCKLLLNIASYDTKIGCIQFL